MNPSPVAAPSSRPTTTVEALSSHLGLVGLLGLVLIAVAVRLSGLSEWWLNPDEGIYYSILTRADFSGFWYEVAANAHPPLYYLLLRGLGLVTWDFFWFRAFSVVCGVAAVAGSWAVARKLTGGGLRGDVAGVVAGTVLALSPGAVELSQVMRPYMLQLALLSWALFLFLRYRDSGAWGDLVGYLSLLCLALLTHYSSALALGVFLLVVALDGVGSLPQIAPDTDRAGPRRGWLTPRWRRLALSHVVPLVVLLALYLLHLRALASSTMADDALDGWLRYYMIGSLGDVWRSFLGFQRLVAHPWLRGPTAILLLGSVMICAAKGPRRVAVLAGGSVLLAVVGAALGLYPFGATRHSTWLMTFSVPALGWVVAWAVASDSNRSRAVRLGLPLLLLMLLLSGGPVGELLGTRRAPWAPAEHVLRQADLTRAVDILDPERGPGLMIMSDQTFNLLMPFYPVEREEAVFSADSAAFHFPYGERRILVSRAWHFTAEGPAATEPAAVGGAVRFARSLASFLRGAARSFPGLELGTLDRATLLVGGWRPVGGGNLQTHPEVSPSGGSAGLDVFEVDVAALVRDG